MSHRWGLHDLDQVLRGALRGQGQAAAVPWGRILRAVLIGGAVYGAVMGSFGLRFEQAMYSAIKVPLLLIASALFCIPSFVILNSVMGLRQDLRRTLTIVLSAQGKTAALLASVAPVSGFFAIIGFSYPQIMVVNGLAFLVCALLTQATLRVEYRELIKKDPRHLLTRRLWLVIYCLVTIQAAWVLRPFVGSSAFETTFFREGRFENAFIAVFDALRQVFL